MPKEICSSHDNPQHLKKIPFSPPFLAPDVLNEIASVLSSGWITTGAKARELEAGVGNITQAQRVLCVNSATAGMELVLRWFGVKPGDEVIVPAYTYCATANIVLHCGATPVMVDVCADTLTMDMQAAAKKITARTKAIIPVDLGGLPCDYAHLQTIVEEKKSLFKAESAPQSALGRILILSDAAHSLGAIYRGTPAVLHTDISVYSFHAVKNLTTAEGGAIALHLPSNLAADSVYEQLRILGLHGQSKDAFTKFNTAAWEYDVEDAGFKYNMSDILAAVGVAGLRHYDAVLADRQQTVATYCRLLAPYPQFQLPVTHTEEKTSAYHLFLLRIQQGGRAERDRLIQALFEKGIATNVHYKPLPMLSLYKKLGYTAAEYPISCTAFEREITLPLFYGMTESDCEYIVSELVNNYAM